MVTRVAALERRISVGRLRGATRGRGTSDEAPVNPVRYPTQTAPTSCCPHMRAAVAVGPMVFKKDPYLNPRRLMGLALSDCKLPCSAPATILAMMHTALTLTLTLTVLPLKAQP